VETAEVIHERRMELGMSQRDLAQATDVDARQIRSYEAAEEQPLLSVAVAIADALKICSYAAQRFYLLRCDLDHDAISVSALPAAGRRWDLHDRTGQPSSRGERARC
jgi:transcriptional regulator with XRE-family HTH domain